MDVLPEQERERYTAVQHFESQMDEFGCVIVNEAGDPVGCVNFKKELPDSELYSYSVFVYGSGGNFEEKDVWNPAEVRESLESISVNCFHKALVNLEQDDDND